MFRITIAHIIVWLTIAGFSAAITHIAIHATTLFLLFVLYGVIAWAWLQTYKQYEAKK